MQEPKAHQNEGCCEAGNADVTNGEEVPDAPFFDFGYAIDRYGDASGLLLCRLGLSEGEDAPDVELPSRPTLATSAPLIGVILLCNEILLDLGLLGVALSPAIDIESIDMLAASPLVSCVT